jgi:hypothetical protein
MIRQGLLTIIFSYVLLVGCRGEAAPAATPTPFPSVTAVSAAAPASIQPITLAELMADPAIFQNEQIEVTGQFYRLPRLICGSPVPVYHSPATFGLQDGEAILFGGGLGSGRDIAPDGLTMTINGRLLSWRGPVGCGKRAVVQEIWYIETNRVISPRPITNATLTPAAVIAAVTAVIDEDQPVPPATPMPTPDEEPEQPPDETPPPLPALPEITPTPTPTLISDDDEERGEEDEDEDETTATPAATPASDSAVIIEQGDLTSGDLFGARLEVGEVHEWRFIIDNSDVLTVMAVADQGNLVLSLLAEDGTLLLEQDEAPPRAIEAITEFVLDKPGQYSLLVAVTDNTTADYHILLLLSDSYNFVMQGLLVDGQEQTNISLAAESDHSWHFAAEEGDSIRVQVWPRDSMDPFIRIYGPDGELIEDASGNPVFIDEGGPGDSEELFLTLSESGLYAVQVGDYGFEAGVYAILLTFDS